MKRKLKKSVIIIMISILLVILFMISLYFYGLTGVSRKSEKVTFTVDAGMGTKSVINKLYDAKLLKSKISTMIYIGFNRDIVIKAGTYELDRSYNTKKIFRILDSGDIVDNTIMVTFVEGKRLIDYVNVISEKFGYSEEEILREISNEEYLKKLIEKYDFLEDDILNKDIYYALEGYLFPATYEFYKDASIDTIIEKMLDKTKNVLDNYNASLKESEYNIHDILTMASIIENETMFLEDKDVVSQVIYKRLDINMSLGMDVTTYYGARKNLGEELTKVDLNAQNAYNTRNTSFLGLPVGPICNPSDASIKAALNPSSTDYIYFYAELKTGKLHFAKTYSEFQEIIRLYS